MKLFNEKPKFGGGDTPSFGDQANVAFNTENFPLTICNLLNSLLGNKNVLICLLDRAVNKK
ncbi:15164_t:CDS:2 [Funneliformis mosseae]|uniref:15164_t:CDS:1 n=1 Tax=Funneliformis mosseae TaxID=27381 RepID=A0A9N9ELU3_FUNMO|nr:15164_t:CDS:2 [Funneliformis mosseae]